MTKRSYSQNCALALGLDVIGDRWTLLVIRGLLTGPKRYSDLLGQLPGMGTNLLATRLKDLAQQGVVEKADDSHYRLSEYGEELRPIVHGLIRWGHRFRDRAQADYLSRPDWDMLALEAAFRPDRYSGDDCVINFQLDGFEFHVAIADGQAQAIQGTEDLADASITTSAKALLAAGEGSQHLNKAIATGAIDITGARRCFRQFFTALVL